MSVRTRSIGKVIINGNWYTVQPGTFEIIELGFEDDDGNPLHPPFGQYGYRFRTENRDEYVGPLSAIELYKLIDA